MPEKHHPPDDMPDWQVAFFKGSTLQRCTNMWEVADAWGDMSDEAKEFLKTADKDKIKNLNLVVTSYANAKVIWRFLFISGGVLVTVFGGFTLFMKTFGDYFTIRLK